MSIRRKLVQQIVGELLEKFSIKRAAVDVEKIAKELNIEIVRSDVDEDVSGYLMRDPKTGKAVIGVNGSHGKHRQRFTIAHELGHYLLHTGETIHVDQEKGALTVKFRDAQSSTGEDDSEREANLFAAELLMPAKFVEKDLPEGEDLLDEGNGLKELAGKYGVSAQAMAFRLANLNYIKV